MEKLLGSHHLNLLKATMGLLGKRHISITDKFILYFVSFNFVAGFVITLVLFYSARDSILSRAGEQLTSVRVVKKRQIESFFADCDENISNTVFAFFASGKSAQPQPDSAFLEKLIRLNRNFDGAFVYGTSAGKILSQFLPEANEDEIKYLSTQAATFAESEAKIRFLDISADRKLSTNGIYALAQTPDNKYLIGFRISAKRINDFMLENKSNEGLGLSGESYIVGADNLMRSKSRFIDSSLFRTAVSTESAKRALGGESETIIGTDYRGVKVLSSFAPLDLPGLRWSVLAEIDFDEVLIPINAMLTKIIFLAIGFSLIIFFTTFFISKSITKPLKMLTEATKRIALHKFTGSIEVRSNDEIGDLTESFNSMAKAIADKEKELSEERISRYAAVLDGQDAERKRLARDLHDGIGQTIVALKLRLESIAGSETQIDKTFVDGIKTQIDVIIDDVRRISNNLMPSLLIEFGIESAITSICSALAEVSLIDINPTIELRKDIKDEKTKIYVFRILQESINNIIKHSNATKALIQLTERKGSYYLRAKDDGQGFDPHSKAQTRGNGLYSIRERVLYLGGKLRIISSESAGTDIQIIIPKKKPASNLQATEN